MPSVASCKQPPPVEDSDVLPGDDNTQQQTAADR